MRIDVSQDTSMNVISWVLVHEPLAKHSAVRRLPAREIGLLAARVRSTLPRWYY